MADALLLPVCIDRITDGNGDPVSQAAVYVYDAGTTTLKAVYTDRGLTSPAANPIRADALGLLPARYITTGAYDLLVKNPLGSTDPNDWSTLYSASGLPGALDTTVFISAGERPVMPTNAVATSTYTVLSSDYGGVIVADPSGGDQTMTLPDPTGVDDGTIVGFIHAGSGNDVIIEDNGGTLNTLDTPGESILYVCDTTEWKVIATNTALPTISAYGLTLIDDADAATARATLGLVIGTDVQAYDAELAAIAGLTSATNKIIRFTGSGTAGLLDFLDEDNMASDSATGIPSQQSVKAYADTMLPLAGGTMTGALALGGDLNLNGHAIDFPSTANISDVLDEDNMASNSATALATQQSIKAYADTMLPLAGGTMSGELVMADQLLTRAFIKDYAEAVNALGSIGGGTQDIDLTLGNVITGTVDTSETTFTFSNPPATGRAGSFTLFLTNGGSQTVNWPASVDWQGGVAPTLTAAGVDILTFITLDAGTTWYGFVSGVDMQ